MIESVQIAGTPCFGGETIRIGPLAPINFFFGPNGSGKTTFTRVLDHPEAYPESALDWGVSPPASVLTYNRDYVRETFGTSNLPGVFLLGQDSIEVHAKIDEISQEINEADKKIETWRRTLGGENPPTGKMGEITRCREELRDVAWNRRGEVPDELAEMLAGTRSSKNLLLEKVLEISGRHKEGGDEGFADLLPEAAGTFDNESTTIDPLPELSAEHLLHIEGASLLKVPIIGNTEVVLAPLIEHLKNSDWVRHGRSYLAESDDRCPFCQQDIPDQFHQELEAYFNTTYTDQLATLKACAEQYSAGADALREQLGMLRAKLSAHLDTAIIELAVEHVTTALDANQASIQSKLAQPSTVVSVHDLADEVTQINQLIQQANQVIDRHNAAVSNRSQARNALIDRCWRIFVRTLLAGEVARYETRMSDLGAARDSLDAKIGKATARRTLLQGELAALQSQVTSSTRAIDDINKLLSNVGFESFALVQSKELTDGYMLVRPNGGAAQIETLSEGERSFITFVYFYYQLESVTAGDGQAPLVAVIDDPISSLDSDILFVATSLVKRLMCRIESGDDRLSQLILCTHNVHFHYEVTYQQARDTTGPRKYFLVRKHPQQPSSIEDRGPKNPIRTAYRSLWDEVQRAQQDPEGASIGLQNILRRILENYFRVMGGMSDKDLVGNFEGPEQVICRSLISWANSGSHTIVDTMDFSPTDFTTTIWLRVFEEIFTNAGQSDHYRMMMQRHSADRI
jgi:wobble nucleotide-excising tRNase